MSYTILKSNGETLTQIVDGQIDQTTTDLTLIGKAKACPVRRESLGSFSTIRKNRSISRSISRTCPLELLKLILQIPGEALAAICTSRLNPLLGDDAKEERVTPFMFDEATKGASK